jgi:hypothetical protein
MCLLWAREVGLSPIQGLQGIAVINGRPAIWGDAALALVRTHPAFVSIREGVEGEGDDRHGWCEITRRDQPTERREFSVADAKRAKLWGKTGANGPTPWVTYPDRMLQMRARGFALRDVFPDALRGVITIEEAQDIPPEPREVPNRVQPPALPPPPSWREMSWPILSRDGTAQERGDVDTWEQEFAARIRHISQHPKLSEADKREKIAAVLAANREVLEWLRERERGHGAVVECVEGLFAEALEAQPA